MLGFIRKYLCVHLHSELILKSSGVRSDPGVTFNFSNRSPNHHNSGVLFMSNGLDETKLMTNFAMIREQLMDPE